MLNGVFKEAQEIAVELSGRLATDICIYNGPILNFTEINFKKILKRYKRNSKLLLILVTNGGSPDAAYKMARYIQDQYEKFTVIVSGYCKSAGTLLALGANEIAFSDYGELGPLDVQDAKEDRIGQLQSGLVVSEAIVTIENQAFNTYFGILSNIIKPGTISFAVASKAATEFMSALYGPILNQIDPQDIGDKARSMRIGSDYGKRLAAKSENLKPETLNLIVKSYSSHEFVIDYKEAEALFYHIRRITDEEEKLIDSLGDWAIYQMPETSKSPEFMMLSHQELNNQLGVKSEQSKRQVSKEDAGNTQGTDGSTASGIVSELSSTSETKPSNKRREKQKSSEERIIESVTD